MIKCLPTDMPSYIDVDISALGLDQTIHLYDIEMPNVEFELSKETPIVSMIVPKAVAVEVKPEAPEEGAEEVVEGEEAPAEEAKEEKAEDKGSKEKESKPPAKKG
jgi:large subunit ribosomal protein L25